MRPLGVPDRILPRRFTLRPATHESKQCSRKTPARRNSLRHGIHLADPAVFEMTASLGFDAIWLDLEHHADQPRAKDAAHREAKEARESLKSMTAKS